MDFRIQGTLLGLSVFGVLTSLFTGSASAQENGGSTETNISPDFDYTVRTVDADGIEIAYVREGSGDPIVFLHGNPTSKYLWRNVIPHVTDLGSAIALDLPGMGDSQKPSPALGFIQQVEVFEAFVDALALDRITLVVHDWGAAIGFDYARQHPERVRAIAVMEGVLPPVFPQPSFEAMGAEVGEMFRAFKDEVQGPALVIDQNIFVEQVLPNFVKRGLGAAEMVEYRRPFVDRKDRSALLKWPREIPIAGEPEDVVERMDLIAEFMRSTLTPILLIHADPGVVVPLEVIPWYEEHVRELEIAFVGEGLHFIQEDRPHEIGRAIRAWVERRDSEVAR